MRRKSLIFPIMGMQIILILATTLSHYYIEVNTLRDTLSVSQQSKAEDIHFIVESIIEKETSKLSGLSKALKNRSDLINGIAHYSSTHDIEPIKKAMDMLFPQLEVDIFQVADRGTTIIYQAHQGQSLSGKQEIHGVVEAMLAEDILLASETSSGWAIRAIVPAFRGNDLFGTITIGAWLNDDFAKNISSATEVEVTIGSQNGIVASSLPKKSRSFVKTDIIRKSISTLKPIRKDYPEDMKVTHYAPMEIANEPFCLIIEIDTKAVFELLEKNKTHIIKVSILILILALSVAAGITMVILRPLNQLDKKAKKTVRDFSGVDLKETEGNEIQTLVRSFNVMVETISAHITERRRAEKELQQHKETLEDLVHERTIELSKSNDKLTRTIKELEWRTNEILLLNKLGDLLHACDTEEETYIIFIKICRQLFSRDSGYLTILDDTQKMLKVVASWGDNPPIETEFEQNQCWAIRRGKEHFVQNPDIDTVCSHTNGIPKNGAICTPMSAQGEVLGMIHIAIGDYELDKSEQEKKQIIESKFMLVKSMVERYAPSLINLRLRETLRVQSIRDPLTSLYNRRHMKEALEREARRVDRRASSLGMIMIDVDHFKMFNDSYGHEAGDKVLRELGGFLKKSIRGEDIACRYGGEEFLLILVEASMDNTKKKAEEIRRSVKKGLKIKHQGKILSITLSLGVALYPMHGETTETALKAADEALYKAKALGRDRVVSVPDIKEEV